MEYEWEQSYEIASYDSSVDDSHLSDLYSFLVVDLATIWEITYSRKPLLTQEGKLPIKLLYDTSL